MRFEGYGDDREGNIRWSDDQTLVNQTDSVACDVSFTYGGWHGAGDLSTLLRCVRNDGGKRDLRKEN